MTYIVQYERHTGEISTTTLPVKTKGRGRKAQIARAMRRIFGDVRVIMIGVAKG